MNSEKMNEVENDSEINSDVLNKKILQSRKKVLVFYFKTALVMFVISVVLVLLGLLWQDKFTLMAWGDALWLAVALEFSAAWMMFIYNRNIMSPVIYGFKTFVLMFAAKKPKTDYYGYIKSIEENQIPTFYYRVIFISSFILLIPAVIIFAIVI